MHFMPRRTFLHRTAALLGGGSVPSARAPAAGGKGRRPTETDIIGPFYRFGAPLQTRLAGPNEPGDRLILTGTGCSARTAGAPVPGALIEVWQASHAGMYDTAKPGNFTEGGALHLRGMLYTEDERGQDDTRHDRAGALSDSPEPARAREGRGARRDRRTFTSE